MGLFQGHAEYVARCCLDQGLSGKVLTLGRIDVFLTFVQFTELVVRMGLADHGSDGTLAFRNADIDRRVKVLIADGRHLHEFSIPGIIAEPIVTDRLFFAALGFEHVDAVDVSDHEGANLTFDLNSPEMPAEIQDSYDLVLDCGTMEHVFDVPQVLRHIFALTKVGGYIIHVMPGNNFYDHGFYQFSPTLFHDYYSYNYFDIIDVSVMEYSSNIYADPSKPLVDRWDRYRSWSYDMELMEDSSFGQLTNALYYSLACVSKREGSTCGRAPTQAAFFRSESTLSDVGELAGLGPIYIFGTARGAALLHAEISRRGGIDLAGFIDLERGGTLFGLPVHPFDAFVATMAADTAVVLSNRFVRANTLRLSKHGFTHVFDGHTLVMALNRPAKG